MGGGWSVGLAEGPSWPAATVARGWGARAAAVRACSGVELGGGGGRLAERGGPGPVRHHFKAGSRSLDREKGTVCVAFSLAERGRSGSGHMHGRSRPP